MSSSESTDMKVVNDSPRKGLEEPTLQTKRWILPTAAVGLLLLGLGIGLAIGLPLAFKNKRQAQQAVQLSAGDGVLNLQGTTRTYYLAADPITWDYAPAGKNLCNGKPFDEEAQLYTSKGIGSKYKKAVYRQYKDDSFKVRQPQPAGAHPPQRAPCVRPTQASGGVGFCALSVL
jgi:hephaestin